MQEAVRLGMEGCYGGEKESGMDGEGASGAEEQGSREARAGARMRV